MSFHGRTNILAQISALCFSLAAGVNVELSHGYRVTERDDMFVNKADQFSENFADATLLQYAVDWIPWCTLRSIIRPRARFNVNPLCV